MNLQPQICFLSAWILLNILLQQNHAQKPSDARNEKPRTIARLVWQDSADQNLRWGDLQRMENEWKLTVATVDGAPILDPDSQEYVQMESIDNALVAGIHDTARGAIGSGWIAIDSGIELEAHGDHFHSNFVRPPKVVHAQVDLEQGNPAHVYRYNHRVFIANDSKNGFTVVTPSPTSRWSNFLCPREKV